MIPFFRRIRNLPAGKAGKMANNPFCSFFLAQKKEPNLPAGRQEKESLHEAIASQHSLSQLHACSPLPAGRQAFSPNALPLLRSLLLTCSVTVQ